MNDLSSIVPQTQSARSDAASSEALLQARYRDGSAPPAIWNETLDLLLSHRSVRAYLPDALPAGTLRALVAAAQSAASSSNLQAWSLIAVEEPAREEPPPAAKQPPKVSPEVEKARATLRKVESLMNDRSAKPGERENARRLRARILRKIATLEEAA